MTPCWWQWPSPSLLTSKMRRCLAASIEKGVHGQRQPLCSGDLGKMYWITDKKDVTQYHSKALYSTCVKSESKEAHTHPDFIRNWTRKHLWIAFQKPQHAINIHDHVYVWSWHVLNFQSTDGVGYETCWIHSAVISSICFKVALGLPWYSIICRTGKNTTKRCEGNLTTGLCQSRAIGLIMRLISLVQEMWHSWQKWKVSSFFNMLDWWQSTNFSPHMWIFNPPPSSVETTPL